MSAAGQITFVGEAPYNDGPPARFSFESVRPQPLGYDALVAARPSALVDIPIEWRDATVLATNVDDLDTSLPCRVTARLQSPFTSRAIGLVKGGWLPSFLATLDSNTTILLDRNVVSEIVARFDGGLLKGRDPDFIDLFANYQVRLNPMPFVMEGNQKRNPSALEVRDQLEEVTRKLAAALPQATLVVGPDAEKGVLAMLAEARPWFDAHQALLVAVAPRLASPIAASRREEVWQACLTDADLCGVKRTSAVLLAVLSALADARGDGPARAVLKFKAKYSISGAYNALCDLRAIETLVNVFVHFPQQPVQFCTSDRALALFWTGLGLQRSQATGAGIVSDFEFHPAVLPEWAVAWWKAASA
ncbi:MAG: hypothetical protein U1C74_12365 [Phenylobacterium sp.]|nr:hypothetical protein [Phenylobacterium sp.]